MAGRILLRAHRLCEGLPRISEALCGVRGSLPASSYDRRRRQAGIPLKGTKL